MVKPIDTLQIEKKFGKPWKYWMDYMQSINASELTHTEIAKKVNEKINDSWWAQTITVAYEQKSGRRKPGQRADGTYEASVTKSSDEDPAKLAEKWNEFSKDNKELQSKMKDKPRISKTKKNNLWKAELENSNKATVAFEKMKNGKTQIAVMQQKIKTQSDLEKSKKFWQNILNKFLKK